MFNLFLVVQEKVPGQREIVDAFIDISPFLWFAIIILLFVLWYFYREKKSADEEIDEARQRWKEERNTLIQKQRNEIDTIVGRFQDRINAQQERIDEQNDYNRNQDQKNLEMLQNVVNAVDKIMNSFKDFKKTPPQWFMNFKQDVIDRISEIQKDI